MARRFTPALSARLFTLFTGAVVVFQLALLAGAPWGALTQGGRTSGVLPDGARAVAAFSAVLLMAFILVVRARAGLRVPTWALRTGRFIWGVVAYGAIGIVANAITPSALERMIWLPVVVVMFCTSVHVARRRSVPLSNENL
ncbi:MAG TPA: hypothetical protein DGD08_10380 [Gemmatimonas aurantiaca]|uniref:Uncharacterized protein n=2 Tax=Gemmatimonas aurantiaca TaxID=173480 RepID=A0A3D4V8Z9_9BACT|nr:hypothetical protein [Gemmatimonas aurantiaca]BAH40397.1 hypothetical membrane protein [Gemmatimonas aurantiaca T-27]HCT57593.1 hypothetical protein [Gemmatimonas aurantiaca]